jgi:4-hydroxyphenylpyruvate dioxygenase
MSLGRANVHELSQKLALAAKYGFQGIELFFEDLETIANRLPGGSTVDNQLIAATEIKKLCDSLDLKIVCLQPFMFYEGLLDDAEHRAKIEKLKVWLQLVKILDTDLISIPSNFMREGVTGDMDKIVSDMVEVAELGLQQTPVVRFAFENLAWATYLDTWEQGWEVVKRVNRSNFGICLDTFNLAGRVWADPASGTGKTENADADLKESLDRLVKTVDPKKVFYIQIVDGERLSQPLLEGHPFYNKEQPSRMSWSRNARLFAFEEERGGYLPIKEVATAFINELGFDGWVSLELFSRTMADPDPSTPANHARRGGESWKNLVRELKL